MKSLITFIFTIFATSMAYAQVQQLDTKEEDDDINVIGFFCKNDTMTYNSHDFKLDIQGTDTIVKHDIEEEFMITVVDSTENGYTMKLELLSCDIRTVPAPFTVETMNKLKELSKATPCIFHTNELGVVETIVNWRDIRDMMKKAIPMLCDEMYKTEGLDSIIPRRQFENMLTSQFATENVIRQGYDELSMLFGVHGQAFKNDIVEVDDVNNGFPSHTTINAFFTPQEEETDMEGDYKIVAKTVTTIPFKDAYEIGINTLGTMLSDDASDAIDDVSDDILKEMGDKDIVITLGEQYSNFDTGWPKECIKTKITDAGIKHKIEATIITWLSRSWYNF